MRPLPRHAQLLRLYVCLFAVGAAFWFAASAKADDDNHAAVVVDFGDGRVESRCVAFNGEYITGYAALNNSGLTVEADQQSGGAAICSIDKQGCPSSDCFCSCPGGGDCVYWSYWTQSESDWRYAVVGAGQHKLRDGDMSGWVWGPSSVNQATPPPPIVFDDVCTAEAIVSSSAVLVKSVGGSGTANQAETIDVVAAQPERVGFADFQSLIGFLILFLILIIVTVLVYRRRRAMDKGK